MVFDAPTFFRDYAISWIDEGERDKHSRSGWIQVPCLFCHGSTGYHLGYNLGGGYFNCWRCGFHTNIEVIKVYGGKSWSKAKELLKEYTTYETLAQQKIATKASKTLLPPGTLPLSQAHRRYLYGRGYDAGKVIEDWGLMATGPAGSYRHRIIAPIYFNGILVSYQGRDITNKADLRYKACRQEDEVIDHQNIVYGIDNTLPSHVGIVVEGITDAWRMGKGTVSTFGIDVTSHQRYLLMQSFRKLFLMPDNEIQAIKNYEALGMELSLAGVDVELILLDEDDPGSLAQEEADEIREELLGPGDED